MQPKNIIVAALVVVVIGVLGWQFLLKGPGGGESVEQDEEKTTAVKKPASKKSISLSWNHPMVCIDNLETKMKD